VVDTVQKELLTPVDLRTLEPKDPAYQSRFEGGVAQRDGAYHQGTVWPLLIGPFVAAHLYAYGESDQAVSFLPPNPKSI
jgi:glycogen debranching enzyme